MLNIRYKIAEKILISEKELSDKQDVKNQNICIDDLSVSILFSLAK